MRKAKRPYKEYKIVYRDRDYEIITIDTVMARSIQEAWNQRNQYLADAREGGCRHTELCPPE